MIRKVVLLLLCSVAFSVVKAQKFALHNNLVSDAMGNLSIGAEFALKPRTTVEMYGGLRPWASSAGKVNRYWYLESQYRFWTCQKFNGFYYGPYVTGGQFNVGGTTLFFGLPKVTKDGRYEGWLIGGGIGCGYEYAVSKHWNVGAEIGAGYTYLNYRKFDCGVCGSLEGRSECHYVGVSKLGLNIIYLF